MATKRTIGLGDLFMGSAPKSGFEALGRAIGGGDAYKALAQQQAEEQLGDTMLKHAQAQNETTKGELLQGTAYARQHLGDYLHQLQADGKIDPRIDTNALAGTMLVTENPNVGASLKDTLPAFFSRDALKDFDAGNTTRMNVELNLAGRTPMDLTKESGGTFYTPFETPGSPGFQSAATPVGRADIVEKGAQAHAALENAATNRGELDLRRNLPQSDVGKINWDFRHGGMDQPTYQAATTKATALPKGVQITGYDDQGRPLISVGGSGMGTQAQNQLELRQINSTEQLARIDQIGKAFDPDYLNIGTRAGMKWAELKDKAGVGLDQPTQDKLRNYVVFKRRAADNLNTIVHDLSGAAVTPQEAQRLTQAIPTPGNGLFDGDSPTEFKAKLDDVTRQLKLAIARTNYARTKGMNRFSMSLGDMENAINQRGAELEQQVRQANPNLSPDLVQAQVDAQLGSEFGLQP